MCANDRELDSSDNCVCLRTEKCSWLSPQAIRHDTLGRVQSLLFYSGDIHIMNHLFTAISKKVVIVNSRYWNRKELLVSRSRNNLLLLVIDFAIYRIEVHHNVMTIE